MMTIPRVGTGQHITPADMPSVEPIQQEIETLREERATIEQQLRDAQKPYGKLLLGAGIGAGLLGGLAVGFGVGHAKGGKAGAIAGVIASLFGANLGAGITGMAVRAPKHDPELVRRRGEIDHRIDRLYQQIDDVKAKQRLDVDVYNRAADQVLARYDHDRDGTIDIAPGQPLEQDERIARNPEGGPATDQIQRVNSLWRVLTAADAAGDGNGTADGREIALELVSMTTRFGDHQPFATEGMAKGDFTWINVHGRGGSGYAHEVRDVADRAAATQ